MTRIRTRHYTPLELKLVMQFLRGRAAMVPPKDSDKLLLASNSSMSSVAELWPDLSWKSVKFLDFSLGTPCRSCTSNLRGGNKMIW